MSLQYPRTLFQDKRNDGQPGIILLPYKSTGSCFQRVILVFLPVLVKNEDQPPAGFPNKQAGIELLRSFLEIFK